jgi:large subunit ribosomal protein L21
MYAVIRSGGKQYRVEEGQQHEVEQLGADTGSDVELTPVLVVDGGRVLATPDQLGPTKVSARVVDPDVRGPKIRGFTYKSKSNQRRRWGHRQHHALIEITSISAGGGRTTKRASEAPPEPAAEESAPAAKKAPAKKAPTAKKAPAKKAPAKKAPAKKGTA